MPGSIPWPMMLEFERIIANTLEGLPPHCKKIVEMSRFKNKKNKEIADELEISVKAVENQKKVV